MTHGTHHGVRPPFAAYGPASAGYGPVATVAEPEATPARPGVMPPPGPAWPAPVPGVHVVAPPPGERRRGLGIASLVLTSLGAFIAFTPGAWFFAWALLLTGLVLAVIHLVRRGTTRVAAVLALVIGILGILIALVAAVIAGLSGPSSSRDAGPVDDDYTRAERLVVADGAGPGAPMELGWDVAAIISDSETAQEVWSVRALTPLDITAETAGVTPAPISVSGSFVAIPFEITNLSSDAIDPDDWQFRLSTDYLAPDGSTTDGVYDPALLDRYPSRYDISTPIDPGQTVVVYEIRDVAFADAVDGRAELWLYSGDSVTWSDTGG